MKRKTKVSSGFSWIRWLELDKKETSPQNVFVHFGLHLATDLGFSPNFENCLICKSKIRRRENKSASKKRGKFVMSSRKAGLFARSVHIKGIRP